MTASIPLRIPGAALPRESGALYCLIFRYFLRAVKQDYSAGCA